jgi:hypothetical protein
MLVPDGLLPMDLLAKLDKVSVVETTTSMNEEGLVDKDSLLLVDSFGFLFVVCLSICLFL